MSSQIDKIWLTQKVRIFSERRYKFYSTCSHWFFSYYSFLLIVLSLFADDISKEVPRFTEINIAISIALFASSLIIHGFKFEEISAKYRDCYLKLGEILDAPIADEEKMSLYHKTLQVYPNQWPYDYDSLVIDRTFFKNEKLYSPQGPIKSNFVMIVRHFLIWACGWIFLIMLFAAPALALIIPYIS